MWLRAELALARKAGYLPRTSRDSSVPDGINVDSLLDVGELGSDKYKVIEAITKIKQELKRTKAMIASQAQIASQKIVDSERTRTAALQEAAYFKAKLTALMNMSKNELESIETERAADLEKRLTQALTEKETLQSKLFQYQQASNNDKKARETAEERARLATARAEEAEEAYARILTDSADHHRCATTAETELRELKAQYTETVSELAQCKAISENANKELTRYKELLEQHKLTLKSVNNTLFTTEEKAKESENSWRQARQDLLSLEKETSKLKNKLEAKTRELNRANSKIDETERLLDKSQKEAEAFRKMVQEMKELFDKSKTNETYPNSSSETDKSNLEKELLEWKTMHAQSRDSATEASKSLSEAKLKISQLESSVMKARQEALILQGQLTDSLDEVKKTKEKLREKEILLEEKTRSLEDAEIKIGMMKEDPKMQEFPNNQQANELREQYQREKEEFDRKFEDLERKLNVSREEKIMVDQSYEALRKEYESIRQDHKLMRSNNEKLQEQLKQSEEKIKELQTELEETLSLNAIVNKELDDALKLAGKTTMTSVITENDAGNLINNGEQLEKIKTAKDKMEKELTKYREANMKLENLNVVLEQKLHESENKVSLLLDQMENAVDTYRGIEVEMKDSSPRNSRVLTSLTSELDMLTSQFKDDSNSNVLDDDNASDYADSRWSAYSSTSVNRESSRVEDYDEIMARLDEVKKAAALRNLNQMNQMNQMNQI